MNRRSAPALTAIMLVCTAFALPGCTQGDPVVNLVAPTANGGCSEGLAGALTRLDADNTLQCRNDSGAYRWEPFTDPYPNSERWVSSDVALTLSGQGRRNPELLSGRWIGYPLDPAARCRVEQSAVVRPGEVGPPEAVTGELGEPLEFEVLPLVATITLAGDCLWQKS